MTLQEIKRDIEELRKKYRGVYFKVTEEEVDGEVKFVDFNIRYKVENDKKTLDSCV